MSFRFLQADATRLPFADRTFDMVLGSPPYCDARTYGIGAQRDCLAWVEWMLTVTAEAQRVSKGPVIWVAAGVTRDRNYWPACEGLMWEWWRKGGECQLYRPVYWHRVGIPGSGGSDWFRADVEYCMCFKRPGELPWSDNTVMGHPPKWGPGGEMSHRVTDGHRRNQWGKHMNSKHSNRRADGTYQAGGRPSHFSPFGNQQSSVGRRADGTRKEPYFNGNSAKRRQIVADPAKARKSIESTFYSAPVLANPGNLVKVNVGGGQMGHELAHENEAPYPEKLAEFFIRSLCPPEGMVLDPFSGSGTTVAVAVKHGRNGIGTDLRESQVKLGQRRCGEIAPLFLGGAA